MFAVLSDARQSWRAIRQQPGNSLLIVLVLTLGMAGVVGMLTILKALVWDPLPFPNARQVVQIGWHDRDDLDSQLRSVNANDFLQLRRHLDASAQVAGSARSTVTLSVTGASERYDSAQVTHNLFAVLGVQPALGRGFDAADETPGAAKVIVLSNALWRARFAADPNVIGRVVRVDANPATIIGVMPPDFAFPDTEQLWQAAQLAQDVSPDADYFLQAFALPASDASVGAMRSGIDTWFADLRRGDPSVWENRVSDDLPLAYLYADAKTRKLLDLMLVIVVMVLLVACANAANLMLARTLAHSRDLVVRIALGASRLRVAGYLLGQSIGLTLLALLLALPLAQAGIRWVVSSFDGTDDGPPPWVDFSIDVRTAAMAMGVALATALLVGILPVLRLRVNAIAAGLRDGGRSVAGGTIGRLARLLVAGELAIACVVLLATLVMVGGVADMANTDLGIDSERLLTANVDLSAQAYPDDADRVHFFEQLTATLRADPQVVEAAVGTTVPALSADFAPMLPEGYDTADRGPPGVRYGVVDDHFLAAYGVELRAGRGFDARDTAQSDPVVVVDERFARRLFPDADPIGRRVRIPSDGPDARWHMVIGVVEKLQLEDLDDPELPNALVALTQHPQSAVSVVVRTRDQPDAFKPQFLALLHALDPDTPAYRLRSFEEVMHESMAGERVLSGMFSAFGLSALLLAAAGLYGLIAQLVGQHTREIGVQRALGASSFHVLHRLLGRLLPQVAIGLLVGVVLAVAFSDRMVAALPVLTLQPTSVAALMAILGAVSLLAVLLPARRALSVDPTVALRYE